MQWVWDSQEIYTSMQCRTELSSTCRQACRCHSGHQLIQLSQIVQFVRSIIYHRHCAQIITYVTIVQTKLAYAWRWTPLSPLRSAYWLTYTEVYSSHKHCQAVWFKSHKAVREAVAMLMSCVTYVVPGVPASRMGPSCWQRHQWTCPCHLQQWMVLAL